MTLIINYCLFLFVTVGAGGLLLDTGVAPGLTTLLPMPPTVVEQVTNGTQEPGVTSIRLPNGNGNTSPISHTTPDISAACRDADLEVCFVCKKCKVAFTSEANLLTHQRQCYNGNMDNRGSYRIVQSGLECKFCPNEKFKNAAEFKKHAETELHMKCIKNGIMSSLPPPSESPLIHEMEDVVNQITLLAARAAQETTPGDPNAQRNTQIDTNSNNPFCQPPEPSKRQRFLTNPQDVPQPLTSAGH